MTASGAHLRKGGRPSLTPGRECLRTDSAKPLMSTAPVGSPPGPG